MTTCPLHPDQQKPCPTCGAAMVRAALSVAPKPPHPEPERKPDTTRDLAIARAKADREEQR